MVLSQRLKASQADVAAFCQRWHVKELSLFGSVIRDDFRSDSDVDVLVVFDPFNKPDLFGRMQAERELADLFGRAVDLTEKRLLKNSFSRLEILQTHRIIYPSEQANFTTLIEAESRMTNDVRNNAALLDMVGAMRSLQSITKGYTFDNYIDNELLRLGVERALEILGEAANRLTPAFRSAHAEIIWKDIVGLRNVIIHQYDQLDYENLWETATEKAPRLLRQVEPLLAPLPKETEEDSTS